MQHRSSQRHHQRRRGIAATEFAVCLPILMVIIIGIIEACSMIYLKQSLSVAAYEGSRVALRPNALPADVTAACNTILSQRNVRGAAVTITPAAFDQSPQQTWVTIRVAASGGANSVIAGWFYDRLIVDGQATMMKEFD